MRDARPDRCPPGRWAAHAYLAAFLPTEACDEALATIAATLDRSVVEGLAAAHRVVLERLRVTDEAAAFTLVAEGGLRVRDAARLTGVPRRRLRALLRAEGVAAPRRVRQTDRAWGRGRPTVSRRALRDGLLVPAAAVGIGIAALAVVPHGATASGPVTLVQDADRQVVVSVVTDVEPPEVLPGAEVDVTVAVLNGGAAPAREVVVVSQLPDELSYVDGSSALEVIGVGGSGAERRSTAPPTAGIEIGELAAGATAEVRYAATVDPRAPGGARLPVVSSAQVEGFGRISSSPAVATVVRRAELELALTSDPGARVAVGQPITWQAHIRNVGTDAARDVRLQWRPALADAVTDIGRIPAGDERTVTVTATAPASAGQVLRQRVEVVHAGGPPVTSETIEIEVVGAHLADTGVPVLPAATTGAGLLAVGWSLLRRSGRRA